jgi:site-specific DNA recombinase
LRIKLQQKLEQHFSKTESDEILSKKRISELQGKIDLLEERCVLNEITKDQQQKFSKKYTQDIAELTDELSRYKKTSSNLQNAIEKGLDLAEDISQLWVSADFYQKQQLQYLVFPEGMLYNKRIAQFEPQR